VSRITRAIELNKEITFIPCITEFQGEQISGEAFLEDVMHYLDES